MIADRTFDRHNQLTDPFTGLRPPADGIAGPASSSTAPSCRTTGSSARRYRLRILNVSQFRAYNLHLSNGAPLVQIAHRQRPDAAAGAAPRILLGPAERVEVIVDFAAARGETVELRSAPATAAATPPAPTPTSAR